MDSSVDTAGTGTTDEVVTRGSAALSGPSAPVAVPGSAVPGSGLGPGGRGGEVDREGGRGAVTCALRSSRS